MFIQGFYLPHQSLNNLVFFHDDQGLARKIADLFGEPVTEFSAMCWRCDSPDLDVVSPTNIRSLEIKRELGVPVEPDEATFNINPALVEAVITSRTKVILPVHLYGQPADLAPILAVARKHKLKVLEDGAQAHGARYKGQRIGAHGDVVAWSFYPGKNLGAYGDAGCVVTNNSSFAKCGVHTLK